MKRVLLSFILFSKDNKICLIIFPIIFFYYSGLCDAAENLRPVKLLVPNKYKKGVFRKERTLVAPPGFNVSLFAAGLEGARFMALGPEGWLYVSLPGKGMIILLPDEDRDGVADDHVIYAKKLDRPHGLAFFGKNLYVAGTGSITKLVDEDGDGKADTYELISEDVPQGGGHWTRSIAVGSDNMLYVSVGSSCNVCLERDRRRAAILRFPLTGGRGELFARGLRNSVGIAFHPLSGELWGSDNGRDWLGDDLPPEELNLIIKGGDYGWPYCYGQRIPDPDFGTKERCKDTRPPEVEMQAHSAPLGIAFGYRLAFSQYYRKMLYIAFHGSWNRSVPTGYKLVGIRFRDGGPVGGPFDIVTGWLRDGDVWGRPVSPIVGSDGALYLSDDRADAIYRITYDERTEKRASDPASEIRK